MPEYTDQLGITISLTATPRRIISLVPSQTELLAHLGLEAEVAGITKFCIHPDEWFRNKHRVGGTKTVDIDKVRALQPHLIIANKEENTREQVEALRQIAPVWTSDVNSLQDAYEMISGVGDLTGRRTQAEALVFEIKQGFDSLPVTATILPAAYLIWKDPYMTVGGDTFISDMLQYCGFRNCFASQQRYPEVSVEQLKTSPAKIILLSSEPYPFKEKHITELQEQLPGNKILLVDGEMFSWYGSRLRLAPEYFRSLQPHQ